MALGSRKNRSPHPSMWRDKSALLRSGLVSVGLVVSLVGCSALMPGGNLGLSPQAGDGPGVTEDSVKVVFIGTDLEAVQEITGFKTEPVGDLKAQVKALETWVNENGGLGGKKMEAVYRLYDAVNDSVAAEEQLCKQITQDDEAFAVVLTGQYQPNARPCYQRAQTLMFDAALMASDQEFYDEMAPFLWTASFPEYGAFTEAQLDVMKEEGFFDAANGLGVIAADSAINKRVFEKIVEPRLKEEGVSSEVSWIDTTDMTSLFQTLTQAATTFRNKRYENVMFLGGSRMSSMFDSASATVQYKARYAMSSFDNPTYFVNNTGQISEGVTEGMVGVGFHPPQEVGDSMSFPNENEKVCIDIFAESDITWENREGARVGLPFCDAVRLLKAGADELSGDFNAWNWAKAVKTVGGDFTPSSGFGQGLKTSNAAAGGYRVMRFDEECKCFVYEGEERSFNE
ncbi:hypothetical protein [Nocardioides jishulii]|uniref:Uncharacterized protein n=1 Tax=Nocardioides jishulii TaxID=2575440 RepID=A0A4U2YMI8_9ACTN|nr:hypothetical protein [Nocardioides jishulii]QCX27611.1 hypothetical protein FCL41_08820 [Nocardioides jishulii]TKI62418.1 hypothetical protein FC770_08485 [Nocardioides jishulii]